MFPRRGLYWFRHDLRLKDNLALMQFINAVDEGIFAFIVDPRWFKSGHYQSAHMGKFRWQFLQESLTELSADLQKLNQKLYIFCGEPIQTLSSILMRNNITTIAANHFPGSYEKQQWQALCELACVQHSICEAGHTLFAEQQLPFQRDDLPPHFTPFRKQVEQLPIDPCLASPQALPPILKHPMLPEEMVLQAQKRDIPLTGGSQAGLQRLQDYLFGSHKVLQYKLTRNGLLAFDDSSKLSPWLANGTISARQVFHEIKRFEQEIASNESTYWLYFELLWREYFQWYLESHGNRLFAFHGVRKKKPMTSFWPERFAKWRSGNTPYPIVNACMNQLNHTGYMSNRGRQLVASCLVHELQLDWRYGAAYFEQQLIDFDVASNWGNWQYLAGVGADPRGYRRFDLEKQGNMYDPNGDFVRYWQGTKSAAPLDSSDMVDWPISWQ